MKNPTFLKGQRGVRFTSHQALVRLILILERKGLKKTLIKTRKMDGTWIHSIFPVSRLYEALKVW